MYIKKIIVRTKIRDKERERIFESGVLDSTLPSKTVQWTVLWEAKTVLAPVRVTSSEFADGRRNEVASPDSEQIELVGAVPHRRNSVSVEQIQDRLRRTAFLP